MLTKIFKSFLLLSFADDGSGSGGGSGGGGENGGNPQDTGTQGDQGSQNPQDTGNEGGQNNPDIAGEKQRIAELEKQIQALRAESEQQKEAQEMNALIERTRSDLKSIEAKFPEWNEQEQRRTVLEIAQKRAELQKNGQDLGERYSGTSGAFLYWKEHLAGNPSPSNSFSGYTPSEYEKKLVEKAESGETLTKEERIKVLNLLKGV